MKIKFCVLSRSGSHEDWDEINRLDAYEEAEAEIVKRCESAKDLLGNIEFKIEKVFVP